MTTTTPRLALIAALAALAALLGCPDAPADEGEGEGEEGEGEEGEGEEGEGEEGEGEEGEGEAVDVFAGLVFNEVGCEGQDDYIEFAAVSDVVVDGLVVTDDVADLRDGVALSGSLLAGQFLRVTPTFGIACGETLHLVTGGGVAVELKSVTTAVDVQGGSWGRLPDGTGEFALNTPTPGAANQSYVDPSEALFQPFQAPLRFDLVMTPAAEASLRDGATEYAYVPATLTVTINGVADAPIAVGVRKKGKVGSRRSFDQKMSWKIDFDRFVDGQSYRRLKKLNLNNMVQDPSTLHEQMAYRLIGAAGLPAPRTGNATLFVDTQNGLGPVEFGTYLLLEAFDEDLYLSRNLPAERVALFEGGLTEAACCDFTDLTVSEVERFEHDDGDEVAGRVALRDLVRRLNDAPADQILASLDTIVDWDNWLTTMALEATIGHWDGYQSSPNNYYLHLAADGRFRLIASGVDQTFATGQGRIDDVYGGGNGFLFRRCMGDGACRAAYAEHLTSVAAVVEGELAAGFEADVDALVVNHMTNFSPARLETDLNNMPAFKTAAFNYLAERLVLLKQVVACTGKSRNDDCTVDIGAGPEQHRCADFSAGLGCF